MVMAIGLKLRPYQRQAVERTLAYFRHSDKPGCLVLPTGAGKSIVIAELCRLARGRVLVLAHVKELCEQNHRKHAELGGQAGLFSAGLGRRDHTDRVVFASIQSVARHLDAFREPRSLVIVDECHRVSDDTQSQYQSTIAALRKVNPEVRVLGLTATPYRLETGWIYQFHAQGMVRSATQKPFDTCIYELSLGQLIRKGHLTKPWLVDAPIAHSDFDAASDEEQGKLNQLLVRHKRVTRAIVEQIQELTEKQNRKGVMIFAATVEHAEEIARELPNDEVGLIVGSTPDDERDRIISSFKQQKIRYLVNVSVLTTGFDAPHVDFIALLRPTESVSLFQQIIGRGLRLHPNKNDCLVVDYAGTGFDPFWPEVGEPRPSTDSVPVGVKCPECGFLCNFWGTTDSEGHVIEHYGRRCQAFFHTKTGARKRCSYRFRFKECNNCLSENDIAARKCEGCASILADPDEKLRAALRLKDALVLRISGMKFEHGSGEVLRVVYHDEDGLEQCERFDFSRPGQLRAFNRVFGRRIANGRRPLSLKRVEHALAVAPYIPSPDFVVFRKRGRHFQVQERIFDYSGRFRRAGEL